MTRRELGQSASSINHGTEEGSWAGAAFETFHDELHLPSLWLVTLSEETSRARFSSCAKSIHGQDFRTHSLEEEDAPLSPSNGHFAEA